MFNRKLKDRIAFLEAEVQSAYELRRRAYAESEETTKRNGDLVKQLRDMDQSAFSISQCTSFEAMRPHIQRMCDMAAARQQAESSRIRNVLMDEIKATYGNNETPIPASPTPLEQKRLR